MLGGLGYVMGLNDGSPKTSISNEVVTLKPSSVRKRIWQRRGVLQSFLNRGEVWVDEK